ncbi:glycosyltransferase family 2 protein [Bacillus infantis]|uniref:glycosyltransferase family A protein n=1 Tax=Bacillus infantis TaxID=324767 RepID=UPI00344D3A37
MILTIFTPAYNRAYTLNKCYESLLRQTCKEFSWLIVDDGSTDNTRELVSKWIEDGKLNIKYIYQDNLGMHGAHNTAHQNINTELCMCCDSDDYLADNAVEEILKLWETKRNDTGCSGIVGLDATESGKIRAQIPHNLSETTLYDLRYRYKLKGDVKLVYRTSLMQQEYYPIIPNEKYLAVGYKYFKLDNDYKLAVLNKILCYVEYLEDGGTKNKTRLYQKCPKGFMHYRIEMIRSSKDFKVKLRNAIHLVSSSIFAKETKKIHLIENKLVLLLALPFGALLNLYIRYNNYKYKKMIQD